MYILIISNQTNGIQIGVVDDPEINEDYLQPGDIAFTLKPEDLKTHHSHEAVKEL